MFSPQYNHALLRQPSPLRPPQRKEHWVRKKKQVLALLAMFFAVITVPLIALVNFGRNWGFVSAARFGDIATVRKDLSWGMNPNTTGKGLHAISGAAYGGHTAIVLLLLNHGANASDGMFQAVMMNRVDIVMLLLRHGASINRLPGYGISPLQEAKEQGYTKIVRLLRQAGAKE